MVERTEYLELIKSWRNEKVIKVITGIRRCKKISVKTKTAVKNQFSGAVILGCSMWEGCKRRQKNYNL